MICKAEKADLPELTRLVLGLWPGHSEGEMREQMRALLENAAAAVFLAWVGDRPVGFAQCQLRRDYVEGPESSPVGYLEGIFVEEPFRGRGLARKLLGACENWAAEQGCREFASDCELDNTGSLAFHLGVGFREANRIICFVKQL